ncbi:hypothetical protein C8R46DRAFT_1308144 [Mycena filopes]|nr:hypothetical protein C8R46DRAFT_1308144 [Mycena filopes]
MAFSLDAADAAGSPTAVQSARRLIGETINRFARPLALSRKEISRRTRSYFSLPSEPTTDLNVLHNITKAHASTLLTYCQLCFGRPPDVFERNLIRWEPRCMVCTRTDQLIRMEAATKNGGTTSPDKPTKQLIPCPRCELSFCCSPAHWEVARAFHDGPCEDAHDGLSHCDMNREVRADIQFEEAIAPALEVAGAFLFAPQRLNASWVSLAGMSWEGELRDEMRRFIGPLPAEPPMSPWVNAASELLSMPMSILYALEKLNDDAYNREEAEGEAALLRKAGATLLPTMGPVKNPWGSIKVMPEPDKIYGFCAVNGWLAGGFK